MIAINGLSKRFGNIKALEALTCEIQAGSIYGLIGSNGAGKSTLLKLLAGIYKADLGSIFYKGELVFGQAKLREEIVLIPDQPCFLPGESLQGMARFYAALYPKWSKEMYADLLKVFPLDQCLDLAKMSKGMQRQAALILALATGADTLLMDEAFDGLDPVMRLSLKKILAREVMERQLTVIIASHNLRELEDFCDHIVLIHRGGVVYQNQIDQLQLGVFKIQCAFPAEIDLPEIQALSLELLHIEKRASLWQLVVRAQQEVLEEKIQSLKPLLFDLLPLTLEELFIYELEVQGYAVRELLS